jgi:2-polyprenyl-3-methyl-5-hydroxy-6-metoxy-1,4-benzoquinol methylase
MNLLDNSLINYWLTKFFTLTYNFSYAALSSLAVRFGKGTHPKHEILKYHHFFLENINKNDQVIDIGSGSGLISFEISKKAKNVTGIEIDSKKVESAKTKFHNKNLKYLAGDATSYPFKEKFDVIVLSNVLEHIDDRIKFLKSIHKLSSKILIRVPMIDRDWLPIYLKSRGFDYRLDPTHFTEYTVNNLQKELKITNWLLESYEIKYGEIWGIIYYASKNRE